jgi:hypothetical protein
VQITNNQNSEWNPVQIKKLVEELPSNSITKQALLAIQNGHELPQYFSPELRDKVQVLCEYYNAPANSEEQVRNIQSVFEEKINTVLQFIGTPLNKSGLPEILHKFSDREIQKILEMQEKYQLKDENEIELIASVMELKSIDEWNEFYNFISNIVVSRLDCLEKKILVKNFLLFFKKKSSREIEDWKVFVDELIPEISRQKGNNFIYFLFFNKIVNYMTGSSLEESREFLQLMQMIPPDVSNEKKYAILHEFLEFYLESNDRKRCIEFFLKMQQILSQDFDSENKIRLIQDLLGICSNKPLDLSLNFLNFFKNNSINLSSEDRSKALTNLVVAAKNAKTLDLFKIYNDIYECIPTEIDEKEKFFVAVFWTRICSQHGMSLFEHSQYKKHFNYWIVFAVPLLETTFHLEPTLLLQNIENVLNQLLPPNTKTVEEAKSLSKALKPLLSEGIITNLHSLKKVFSLFREIQEPLRSNYSQLIALTKDKSQLTINFIKNMISWIRELKPSSYQKEEFFSLLIDKLQKSSKTTASVLAKKLLMEENFGELAKKEPLRQVAEWFFSIDVFETSLKSLLNSLLLNPLSVAILSKEPLTFYVPKNLKESMEAIEKCVNTFKTMTKTSSPEYFKEKTLDDIYNQTIQKKLSGSRNPLPPLQQMEKFFGLDHLSLEIYKVQSDDNKMFLLQNAQFLIEENCSVEEKTQFLSSLIPLLLEPLPPDRQFMMKILDRMFEKADTKKKIEWLNVLKTKKDQFSSFSDFQRMYECIEPLMKVDMRIEDEIFIVSRFLHNVSLSEKSIDYWVQYMKTTPHFNLLTKLVFQRYGEDVRKEIQAEFLSALHSKMDFAKIREIGDEKASIPIAMKSFADAKVSPECIARIRESVSKVHYQYRIKYSALLRDILGNTFLIQDLNSVIKLLHILPIYNNFIRIQGNLYSILKNTLDTLIASSNEIEAFRLSKNIFSCQKILKLKDDSDLMQTATKNILYSDFQNKEPSDFQNKEPYFTQAHIKQKKLDYPSSRISETIERIFLPNLKAQILLKLDGLQKGLTLIQKEKKKNGEFKAWIEMRNAFHQERNPNTILLGPDFFQHFFGNIFTRLDLAQNSVGLEALKEEILLTSKTFLDKDYFAAQKMQEPFLEDEKEVPEMKLILYLIADAILEQYPTPQFLEGHYLSDQEESALLWLSNIENCSVGQVEGALKSYEELRSTGVITEDFLSVNTAELCIAKWMQIAMNDLLKSDLFFNVLKIQHSYIDQGVHQTLYLKNILGKDCGLDHEESVDPFPNNNISPTLYQYNRDYLLKVFFYYLSKTVVSSFRKSFQELGPKLKIQTQNLLTDYFMQNDISLEKSWITKEAPFHVRFSDEEPKVSLNLATLHRCLSLIPREFRLWSRQGKLTLKGIEDFEIFLAEKGQDPSIILPSGEITEASMVPFLQFVEDYKKKCAIEIVYNRLE